MKLDDFYYIVSGFEEYVVVDGKCALSNIFVKSYSKLKELTVRGITMKINIEEESDLVILRNTQEDDLDFVVNSEREHENAQYVGQWTKEQHRNSLCQEDIVHLIVEEKYTNKPVGYVIIGGITNPNKNIEFRRIVISSKGKGLGRETLKLVKKIAFEQLNAHRLWLDVRHKNQIAQKLYKTEGFIEEGTMRECILHNGNYESLIVMSILENEYIGKLNS